MTTQLEQSLIDICKTHGLTALLLNYHSGDIHEACPFSVYVHRDRGCGSASKDSIGSAIGFAIADLNARSVALADEPLLVGGV